MKKKKHSKSLMPTIIGRLTGASFQTELLVMNLLGLVNSLRKWELGWTNQVDAVKSSERLGEIVKIILCWVVKLRIIIADIYTVTYLANFYSILTWCRERTLFPWMIISAFDNFLLEFIGFSITLLLWLETSISSALFIEYVIARAIPRVPAFYYWCIINLFRADLRENQRRKLTLASAQQAVSETSNSADRIRFGAISCGKDYFEKLPRFASLTNLDDFSLHSSTSKYDDDQEYYKRSKSLVTFISIDSDQSDEPEEYHTLKIFDDDSLTPIEKAIKILKLNDEDINEARLRVTEKVFPDSLKVEKTDEVISTVAQSIANTRSENLGRSISLMATNDELQAETMKETTPIKQTIPKPNSNIKNVYQFTVTSEREEAKDRSNDGILSREGLKMSTGNPSSSCICRKIEKKSVSSAITESGGELDEFYNKNRAYENDDDDSSGELDCNNTSSEETGIDETTDIKLSKFLMTSRSHFTREFVHSPKLSATDDPAIPPTVQISQQLVISDGCLRAKEVSLLSNNLTYREDPRANNCELFRVNDMALEPREHPKKENSRRIVNDGHDGTPEHVRQVLAENDFSVLSPCTSKSTQTNISDCWNFGKPPKVSCSGKTSKIIKPHLSSSSIPNLSVNTTKLFRRFTKTMRSPESIGDREAREMRALRAYNKLTLLEDKREMETKKQKTAFSNRAQFQGLICPLHLTDPALHDLHELARPPASKKMNEAKLREELNREEKRQTRSRSPEETSKLSAFRTNLDALQTSISLGFSSDNKTRFRFQKGPTLGQQRLQSNYPPSRTHQNVTKPSSKCSESKRFQNDQNGPTQSATRIEDVCKEDDHRRAHGVEHFTDCDPTPKASRMKNALSRIIPPPSDKAEIQGTNASAETIVRQEKHEISSIQEAITSLNWNFVTRDSDNDILVSRRENTDWNRANFLWDILDDTNTVTLLQSAFSSNPANTSRGFYLNPGSTELYSMSNYLDNVVEEIMKTTGLSLCNNSLRHQSTNEIDYGDCFLEEFEVTGLSTTKDISEDNLSDSDTETTDIVLDRVAHFDAPLEIQLDPLEMCWNSYSSEGFETRPKRRREKTEIEETNASDDELIFREADPEKPSPKNRDGKSIADILGTRELIHLENWTRELKKLAHHDRRKDSLEIANCIKHLTNLPGFCVIKMVVDFFRNFLSVSRSTMTSRTELTSAGTDASISTVIDQSFAGPQHTGNPSDPGISPNIESSSQVRSRDTPRQEAQQPLRIDTTSDSYDSLYSAAGNSRHSDNAISIGGRSSMEEFSCNSLNATESHR